MPQLNGSSIKDRIAFFDASTPTTKTIPSRPTTTGFAKNGVSPLLSRSCSAPYDSDMNGDSSPPSAAIITNGVGTKVRVEPKSPSTLSKLKGLIIPYLPDAEAAGPKHQLPIIKSEQLYRVPLQESTQFQSPSVHETEVTVFPPPLRPANITVAKYSPMFKRRELSLPPADLSVVGSPVAPIKLPPTVPPKPKANVELEHSTQIEPVVPPMPPPRLQQQQPTEVTETIVEHKSSEQLLCKNQVKPVDQTEPDNEHLPQIEAVTNECQAVEKSIVECTSTAVQVHEDQQEDAQNDNDTPDNAECTPNSATDDNKDADKSGEDSCDFIIYQRQYSMRAIMLDDVTPTNLGLTLCGGLDSRRKEVTVSAACVCLCLAFQF